MVAHRLQNDPSEGAQRTCLGRAYYYVYNGGLIKARTLSFDKERPGLHKKLWAWCEKHADPDIRSMGTPGLRMYSLRIEADYSDAPIKNLAGEVKMQLTRAQNFEGLVAKSNGQLPPPTLVP